MSNGKKSGHHKLGLTGRSPGLAALALGLALSLIWSASGQCALAAGTTGPKRYKTYKGKNLEDYTEAIQESPNNPQLYFNRGMLHNLRDERTEAIEDLSKAIKLKPDFIQAYRERAVEYVMTAKYDKAEQDADRAVKLDPGSADTYETRGWTYAAREEFTKAIADWKHANSIDANPYYYYRIATNLVSLGKLNEAQQVINQGIELNSRDETASYRGIAGIIAAFKQDLDESYKQLKLATEAPDGRGVEWAVLAYYYVCAGKPADVESTLQRAKALETFPARMYRLAGEVYRTAGQYDKAIQEFNSEAALEQYPPGFRERAVTHISLGQWRPALEDLTKSLQLNPHSATTLSYMAMVEDQLGMADKSMEHISAAFRCQDLPPLVYVNRAQIELRGGDAKKALEDANTALNRDQWLKEGYEIRSRIYEKLNQPTESKVDADKASKLISHLDL